MERILIVAGALHIGGAERIAANICCYAHEKQFEFHYVVFEGYENVYGPEIEAHGGKVITIPSPRRGYLRYCQTIADLIRKYRYTTVHSHTQFNSGFNMLIAKLMRVPIRIAHSHTTKTECAVSTAQKLYECLMRHLVRRNATHLMACGIDAGRWMFGKRAFDKRGIVLKNGIDTAACAFSEENRNRLREACGIAEDSYVIGHVGTILPVKNQEFLIRLLPELRKRNPKVLLLLVGGGIEEERTRLETIAQSCGVRDAVMFTGGVSNVNELLSVMDVFAFPSLREGTPLALLEAQANGLPCVVSDRIPKDALLTELVKPLSLETPESWISALLDAKRRDAAKGCEELMTSGYDFREAYQPLYSIYRSEAVVSFSFDDGRGDNAALADSLFSPNRLPMTLNITTGYVDRTCPTEQLPCDKPAMKREDVQRLAAEPEIEIAMHGDRHQNTPEDVSACAGKLREWLALDDNTAFGFASPNSKIAPELLQPDGSDPFCGNVKYIRISYRIRSRKLLRTMLRKAGRVIHLPIFYRIAYHDTIMTECDGKILYSVPVMGDVTVPQILTLVRDCVKRRGALVLMFHSVEPQPAASDVWTWSEEKMRRLCAALLDMQERGVLRVCTSAEQFKLLRERT